MEKTSKKWFLKNIFRKNNGSKKEHASADFSSDEEDAKAGFYSADFYLKKFSPKKKPDAVNNNIHQIYNPKANSEFCYFEAPQRPNPEVIYQTTKQPRDNNVYHNFVTAQNNNIHQQPRHYSLSPRCFSNTELSIEYGSQASSQDEKLSCNSFTPHMVNVNNEINSRSLAEAAANKKTRAARNQRYYQRLLRDEGRPSTIYGCVYDDFSSLNDLKSQQLPNSVSNQSISRLPGPRYRGATLSDLDDYENILKVEETVPPPIPPRDPNRRFSMHNSITKNPYYFDHQLQKYVVINKNNNQQSETLNKPQYVLERKSDAYSVSSKNKNNNNNNRSNSTNDLALKVHHHEHEQPKSYQRYNKHRNLTITEGVKFPFSMINGVDTSATIAGVSSSRDHVHQMPHKKFSSFEDINRYRGVNTLLDSSSTSAAYVNQNSSRKNSGEKKSNLDDAINELEKMYKRLMSDECLLEFSDHRQLPTLDTVDYSEMMKKYEEYEREENSTDREPDLVKDDVFSRNLKHANKMQKNIDQLPFGIPNQAIIPIPPKPPRDYLSVKPSKSAIIVSQTRPDLIADDLAVRNLRRDNFTNSKRTNSTSDNNNNNFNGTLNGSREISVLSPVTAKLHLGILSGAKKPSGGKQKKDNVVGGTENDVDSETENKELEESLNALIIESKAISEKLEEDLSKMKMSSAKQTKSINRISSVDLLDFEKKKDENKMLLRSPPSSVKFPKDVERVMMDVKMVSTACSPIKELQTAPVDIPKTPTKSHLVRGDSVEKKMPQASPKISDLIQMFSKENESNPSTPMKINRPTLKLRSKSIETISKRSPEKSTMNIEKSASSQSEFETNIENIRDLIKQMKKTEFDLATPTKQLHKPAAIEQNSREPSTDFDQKSTGTESIITTNSSLMMMELESNEESLPKINTVKNDEATVSAIIEKKDAIDDNKNRKYENENEIIIDDNNNNNKSNIDDVENGEFIVLRDESCSQKFISDVENINEDETETTTPADDESKMTLEEKVKKQLENISLNLEKFKEDAMTTMPETSSSSSKQKQQQALMQVVNDANNNNLGQVLDVESLYNSTEELSMIFANAENYVSQGNEDELDVLDAEFVAASEKEFEKLVLDCNNNNSDIFDNQMTNGDFALGMSPLSSVEAQSKSTKSINKPQTSDDDHNNACSTQSTKAPSKETMKKSKKDEMKLNKSSKDTQKKPSSSTSSTTNTTLTPLSTLQEQAFVLACVYFIILLTQLLTFK
jgi:hypothetical protein